MPPLAILLPTFNGARYLEAQLNSILAQGYSDFELLAIDDGSHDSSASILDRFAARDSRVTRLPASDNRGQKARLGELLAAARAPLIAFADQDDIWGDEKLQRLCDSLGDHSLAFGPSHLIDAEGRSLGKTLMEALSVAHQADDKLSLLRSSRVSAHAMVCRREILHPMIFKSELPFDRLISMVAVFANGVTFVRDADTFHRLHGANAHNGGVLKMLRPWKIRPRDISERFTRFRSYRRDFLEELNQLANSSTLDPSVRITFTKCAALCTEAWQDNEKSPSYAFRALRNLLFPLAGSQRDWDHFRVHLWSMCLNLPRHVSALVPYPR
ncbi:glycosyltransferase [Qipengyuania sp. CAU 1752]